MRADLRKLQALTAEKALKEPYYLVEAISLACPTPAYVSNHGLKDGLYFNNPVRNESAVTAKLREIAVHARQLDASQYSVFEHRLLHIQEMQVDEFMHGNYPQYADMDRADGKLEQDEFQAALAGRIHYCLRHLLIAQIPELFAEMMHGSRLGKGVLKEREVGRAEFGKPPEELELGEVLDPNIIFLEGPLHMAISDEATFYAAASRANLFSLMTSSWIANVEKKGGWRDGEKGKGADGGSPAR